jgi:hypothetical protein
MQLRPRLTAFQLCNLASFQNYFVCRLSWKGKHRRGILSLFGDGENRLIIGGGGGLDVDADFRSSVLSGLWREGTL